MIKALRTQPYLLNENSGFSCDKHLFDLNIRITRANR